MRTLRLSTLSVDIEDEWLPYEGREQHTVILRFGSVEVVRWVVDQPDARWQRGYGAGDDERIEAAEEFVARKLAAALAAPTPAAECSVDAARIRREAADR